MNNDQQPLVSVLVPLYNHANYVIECLESVAGTGYRNIELIVHDDCSTDDSAKRVHDWLSQNKDRFSRSQLEYAASNRGVVGALNKLISMANGDYIVCPLASDDKLLPGSISSRVRYLQEHPQFYAVFCDARAIDAEGKVIHQSCLTEHYNAIKKNLVSDKTRRMELIRRWTVPGPVIMYRREAFDEKFGVGTYDESFYLEDRDMYLRLLEQNALGFLDETVAEYRLHGNNAMNDPKKMEASIHALTTPMLRISKSNKLDRFERFSARHIALAMRAEWQSTTTTGLAYFWARFIAYIHRRPARSIARIYLMVRR